MATNFTTSDASAPRTQVAEQITGILIWRVDFDVHDGFQQSGTRQLHGFFEGERAGDFERDVGRIHVVIFTVIENGTEISHGETREKATHRSFANAAFDGWNPVVRNCSAKNIVHE